ncbi:hypothetical protein HPULCUR_004122 [Helicostylum pulchrum]|uniref:Uncharacterized protein n=1 Tax=Helicostylum pulchrum TaxID=562976 RepID=A0ABP9XVA0_9FUNG
MTSIKDLLKNGKPRSSEDTQLKLALELSKEEHIKEQKRLLQQFSKPIQRKRRIIQKEEEEDNDDWFQTISSRPQHKNQAKIEAKKEEEKVVVNEDKEETVKHEEPFEFDLSSIFDNDEEQQEEENTEFLQDNANNTLPMVSDAESDCSVIDLCNEDANQTNTTKSAEHNVEQSMQQSVENSVQGTRDNDDGYLSPLEGFVSLNDSERSQQYLAQFTPKPTRKRKATTTTTKRKKNKRWYKRKTNK